ncbi:MAG: phosphate acetyltransferase [Bacteroidetes bacterium]|nr:phosphate acetyltransferase [Bacteroidota bacterium]
MTFAEKMKNKASSLKKILVLPEGTESRTIMASRLVLDQGIAAKVILIGNISAVQNTAQQNSVDLQGIEIVDPVLSKDRLRYAEEYAELRKHKGLTKDEAYNQITEPLKWGAMMVRLDDAHAMVAGAENSTGKVLVAAFTIIKTKPGTKFASSSFIMSTDKTDMGVNGSFIFSDCATIPDPTSEQLAEIGEAASDSCRVFLDAEPATAFLSFSTKGSASHPFVDKVTAACAMLQKKRPDILCDGELQLDAAIVPYVGSTKAPNSKVAGKANVLVFPDLQSGNIGYKLVQRLAGAEAFGPVLQGFAKPISDLSRGCSVEDIVVTSAMTLAQSKQ